MAWMDERVAEAGRWKMLMREPAWPVHVYRGFDFIDAMRHHSGPQTRLFFNNVGPCFLSSTNFFSPRGLFFLFFFFSFSFLFHYI